MAYSKNDCVQVTIEDIGVSGEGIGKIDGYTLFVKDTVIGDVVNVKIMKAKKNYGYARLVDIVTGIVSRLSEALSAVKFVPDSWKTAFTSLWCCGKVFRDHVTGYALF